MIKAIIFDWGGVLSEKGGLAPFINLYAHKYGKDPEYLSKLNKENWEKARINRISSKTFWINISKFLEIEPEKIRREWLLYEGFRKDVFQLAKELKRNYKVAMLTNQIEDWLEEKIKKHKLDMVFDLIVKSYESRKAKPNIEIYKEAVDRLKAKPEECVFIDDMESNLLPAEKLGMKTVLFKDTEKLKGDLIKLGVKL